MVRKEYPRPQLVRSNWQNLNGDWEIQLGKNDLCNIVVPFVYQCKLSGVQDKFDYETVTYYKQFAVSKNWNNKKVILHFGAVDYISRVFVNDHFVGEHIGSSASFSFDITEYLTYKTESLKVVVYDPSTSETIPRGKQTWESEASSIWYTKSTGIWQTVWLEPVSYTHISDVRFTSDIDKGDVEIEVDFCGNLQNCQCDIEILFKREKTAKAVYDITSANFCTAINLFDNKIMRSSNHHNGWCWSPETPNLFDITIKIKKNDDVIDEVQSYFGMRKIQAKNGKVYLNNRPYYQKLILDQGYFENSLLTAPSDAALKHDILLAKEMGFNGCRKHQKAEDPRFLYWADVLGYLVWGEIPSAPSFSSEAVKAVTNEWFEIIKRDYNHPSIVAWVTINESWGVPNLSHCKKQQAHVLGVFNTVKSLDNTRLVVGNDGWEMLETDICAVHNYNHGATGELQKQKQFETDLYNTQNIISSMPANRSIYLEPYMYNDEPIMLTEFGGMAFASDSRKNWGYTYTSTEEEFINTYERILNCIFNSQCLVGFCYTQLTDVEQEQNGLLTADRKFKCDPKKIKKANRA